MKSEQIFLILGQLTGLKLHELNKDENNEPLDSDDEDFDDNRNLNKSTKSNPRCSFEIRKFEKGCYTLIHDYDGEVLDENPKLDVKLYLNHEFNANPKSGGCTHYVEKTQASLEEDEQDALDDGELLTIEPINNALSIVYRDDETVRFHKYLNCTHEGTFYELSMIFQE